MQLHLHRLPLFFTYLSVWADLRCLMTMSSASGMSFAHRIYEIKPTLFALCTCSCGGIYNAYVHPRRIYLSYLDHTFEGFSLKAVDFFGHHVILTYFYVTHVLPYRSVLRRLSSESFGWYVWWLPMLYVLSMPWDELYGFEWIDVIYVALSSLTLYACLLAFL